MWADIYTAANKRVIGTVQLPDDIEALERLMGEGFMAEAAGENVLCTITEMQMLSGRVEDMHVVVTTDAFDPPS